MMGAVRRLWNPDLHPRDRLGRFKDVNKTILNMPMGTSRNLADVVDDAPYIDQAVIFRTPRGFEIRAMTSSGPVGVNITPEQLMSNRHIIDDTLQAIDNVDPFPDMPECPHCGMPSPDGNFLPGHQNLPEVTTTDVADKLNNAAEQIDANVADEKKKVSLKDGLRNIRQFYADRNAEPGTEGFERWRNFRDEVDAAKAIPAQDLGDLVNQLGNKVFGRDPNRIPKVKGELINSALNGVARDGMPRYIYYDVERGGFLPPQNRPKFFGEAGNESGQLLLRGTVDKNGKYKSWYVNEGEAHSRPSVKDGGEEGYVRQLFRTDQDRTFSASKRQEPTKYSTVEEVDQEIEKLNKTGVKYAEELKNFNTTGAEETADAARDREELVRKIANIRDRIDELQSIREDIKQGRTPNASRVDLPDFEAIDEKIAELTSANETADAKQKAENDVQIQGLKAQQSPEVLSVDVDEVRRVIADATPEKRAEIVGDLPESTREQLRSPVSDQLFSNMPSVARDREMRTQRELEQARQVTLDALDSVEAPLEYDGPEADSGVSIPIQPKETARGLERLFMEEPIVSFEGEENEKEKQLGEIDERIRNAKRQTEVFQDYLSKAIEQGGRLSAEDAPLGVATDKEKIKELINDQKKLLDKAELDREAMLAREVEGQMLDTSEIDAQLDNVEYDEREAFRNKIQKSYLDNLDNLRNGDFKKQYEKITGEKLDERKWTSEKIRNWARARAKENKLDQDIADRIINDAYRTEYEGNILDRVNASLIREDEILRKLDLQNKKLGPGKSGKILPQPVARRGTQKSPDDLEFRESRNMPITIVGDTIQQDINGNANGVWVSNDGFYVMVDFSQRAAEVADRFNVTGENAQSWFLFRKSGNGTWQPYRQITKIDKNGNPVYSNEPTDPNASISRLVTKTDENGDIVYDDITGKPVQEWQTVPGNDEMLRREIAEIEDILAGTSNRDTNEVIDGKTVGEWRAMLAAKRDGQRMMATNTEGLNVAEGRRANMVGRFVTREAAQNAARQAAAKVLDKKVAGRSAVRQEIKEIEDRIGSFRLGEHEDHVIAGQTVREWRHRLNALRARVGADRTNYSDDIVGEIAGLKKTRKELSDDLEFNISGMSRSVVQQRLDNLDETISQLETKLRNENNPDLADVVSLDKKREATRAQLEAQIGIDEADRDHKWSEYNRLEGEGKATVEQAHDVLVEDKDLEDRIQNNREQLKYVLEEIIADHEAKRDLMLSEWQKVESPTPEDVQQHETDRRVLEKALHEHRSRFAELGGIPSFDVEFSDGSEDPDIKDNLDSTEIPEFALYNFDSAAMLDPNAFVVSERQRSSYLDMIIPSTLAAYADTPEADRKRLFVYQDTDGTYFFSPVHPRFYAVHKDPSERPRVLMAVNNQYHAVIYGDSPAERISNHKFVHDRRREGGRILGTDREIEITEREDSPNPDMFEVGLRKWVPNSEEQYSQIEKKNINRVPITVRSNGPGVERTLEEQHSGHNSRVNDLEDEIQGINSQIERIKNEPHMENKEQKLNERHKLLGERKRLLEHYIAERDAAARDLQNRKDFDENGPEKFQTEMEVAKNIRGGIADAIEMQQSIPTSKKNRTVQVYLAEDGTIEYNAKNWDKNRRRIATVTGGKGGANPEVNWKDDEVKKLHDEAGYPFQTRVEDMFDVSTGENQEGLPVYFLRSKAIHRHYADAQHNNSPENIRVFNPANHAIEKLPDGNYRVAVDYESDPVQMPKIVGDFTDLEAAFRAVHAREMSALARDYDKGGNPVMMPSSNEQRSWELSGKALLAKPNPELGIDGEFHVRHYAVEMPNGKLESRFEASRHTSNGDRVEQHVHKDLKSAISDVDDRIRNGYAPNDNAEILWWTGDDENSIEGSADHEGNVANYKIDVDNGRFNYKGKTYASFTKAEEAAIADENARRVDLENAKNGVRVVSEMPRPAHIQSDDAPVMGKKDLSQYPSNTAGALNTRTTKSRGGSVDGPKGAKTQGKAGLRTAPPPMRPWTSENNSEVENLFGGLSHDQLRSLLRGETDRPVVSWDYETLGNGLFADGDIPIQIGAVKTVNGEEQVFDQWIYPENGAKLGGGFNAVGPDGKELWPTVKDENGNPTKDENKNFVRINPNMDGPNGMGEAIAWLRENGVSLEEGHKRFAEFVGNDGTIGVTWNGFGFDEPILKRHLDKFGLKIGFVAGVDGMALAKRAEIHDDMPPSGVIARNGNGNYAPNLRSTYFNLTGEELENAHNASADARASQQTIDKILEKTSDVSISPDYLMGASPRMQDRANMPPAQREETAIQQKSEEIMRRPNNPSNVIAAMGPDEVDEPSPVREAQKRIMDIIPNDSDKTVTIGDVTYSTELYTPEGDAPMDIDEAREYVRKPSPFAQHQDWVSYTDKNGERQTRPPTLEELLTLDNPRFVAWRKDFTDNPPGPDAKDAVKKQYDAIATFLAHDRYPRVGFIVARDNMGGFYSIDSLGPQEHINDGDVDWKTNKRIFTRTYIGSQFNVYHTDMATGEVQKVTSFLATDQPDRERNLPTLQDLVVNPPTNKDGDSLFKLVDIDMKARRAEAAARADRLAAEDVSTPETPQAEDDPDPIGFDPSKPAHVYARSLMPGDTDMRTKDKDVVVSIEWTPNGPIIEHAPRSRKDVNSRDPEDLPIQEDLNALRSRLDDLRGKQAEAKNNGDEGEFARIDRLITGYEDQLDQAIRAMETPVENREQRGEGDLLPGQGMRVGGQFRMEMVEPDDPDFIDEMMMNEPEDRGSFENDKENQFMSRLSDLGAELAQAQESGDDAAVDRIQSRIDKLISDEENRLNKADSEDGLAMPRPFQSMLRRRKPRPQPRPKSKSTSPNSADLEDAAKNLRKQDRVRVADIADAYTLTENQAMSAPDVAYAVDRLDGAMNNPLRPLRINTSGSDMNAKIRELLETGNNGDTIGLDDMIDMGDFIDVKSATLRKENGYVSVEMTRLDGSKIAEYTKERLSPNSYLPWLHRQLAFHGNGEIPSAVPAHELKSVLSDAENGATSVGPAGKWVAHMGRSVHDVVMRRIGITPLHNGYDGQASLRRDQPENFGLTRLGPDGVPHVSIHADVLKNDDPVEVFLHEQLHAISPAINNHREVVASGMVGFEEGLVHAYSKHLLPDVQRQMGYDQTHWNKQSDRSPYKAWAMAYEAIRFRAGMTPDQFYGKLLTTPIEEREDMLRRFAGRIDDPKKSGEYLRDLNKDLGVLRGSPRAKYPYAMPSGFAMPAPRGLDYDRNVEPNEAPFMTPSYPDNVKIPESLRPALFEDVARRLANGERIEAIAYRHGISATTLQVYAQNAGLQLGEFNSGGNDFKRLISRDEYSGILTRLDAGEDFDVLAEEFQISKVTLSSNLRKLYGNERIEKFTSTRKIPVEDFDKIVERRKNGEVLSSIANDYGVTANAISALLRQIGYVHAPANRGRDRKNADRLKDVEVKSLPDTRLDEVKARIAEGGTWNDVAKHFGVSYASLLRFIVRHDLEDEMPNTKPKGMKALVDDDLDRVKRRISMGGTRIEIAKDLGVGKDTLWKFMKKHSLSAPRSKPKFDPEKVAAANAKLHALSVDQENDLVKRMSNQTLTLEEAAIKFNVGKVTVSRIMERNGYKNVRVKGQGQDPQGRRWWRWVKVEE